MLNNHLLPALCATSSNYKNNPENLKEDITKSVYDMVALKTTVRFTDRIVDRNSVVSLRADLPSDWTNTLMGFWKKHSPPKKKHLKILIKFVPTGIDNCITSEAAALAERLSEYKRIHFLFKCLIL